MSILIFFLLCSLFSMIGHLWVKTDVAAYYLKALKKYLPKKFYSWLLVEEFFNRPPDEYIYLSLIEYLNYKRQFSTNFKITFILKLLSCPLCFGFWMSLISSIISGNVLFVGVGFIIIRFFDWLLNFFLKSH
jgi:hypothetical protein